jgi:uncharacterized membrane-anchored protein
MKNRGTWLAIIVGLQSLCLIGMAVSKERNLHSATPANTVLLETIPVDPRDLLRGDYVILNYKISSMPVAALGSTGASTLDGRTVWIALEKRDKFHEIAEASLSALEEKPGQILVRGTLESSRWGPSTTISVNYGIERYYVPEGLGNPDGKVTVECVVADDRTLQIKQLYIKDRPFDRAANRR